MLIESYEKQGLWVEGTKAVIQALLASPSAVTSIAKTWARLKREVAGKDDMFKSMYVPGEL